VDALEAKIETAMSGDDSTAIDRVIPAELQQQTPRKTRLTAMGVYCLVGSMTVSGAIAALVILVGSLTPKEIRDRHDLEREGRVTYTNDVQAGGMRSATVFYTFTYDGQSYSGKARLPHDYLEKVLNYSKSGGFPVLFLPRDPSINHPYDWKGNGPFPFIGYLLILIVIVQWTGLIRFFLRDFRLARSGLTAVGKVTECSQGNRGGIRLGYEFRDMDGLPTNGRGDFPARRDQGANICVLYLPDQTESSRPYPLLLFRAVK
jgi:hypothetical protein